MMNKHTNNLTTEGKKGGVVNPQVGKTAVAATVGAVVGGVIGAVAVHPKTRRQIMKTANRLKNRAETIQEQVGSALQEGKNTTSIKHK